VANYYPAFYEYDKAILTWLREIFDLPQFNKAVYSIVSATRVGTTGGGVNQHELKIGTADHKISPASAIRITGTTAIDGFYTVKSVSKDVLILDAQHNQLPADQAIAGGMAKLCINVINAEMDRAIASIAQPMRQGTIKSPGVAFYRVDNQFDLARSRPKENVFTRRFFDPNGNKISSRSVPPMLEYKLSYTVNVWALYRQFLSVLDFQMLSEFRPEKYLWIPGGGKDDAAYGMDYEGCRMNRQFHGQWAHLTLESANDASEFEPGDAENKTMRMEYTILIDNAFVPTPFRDDAPIIGKINIEEHVDVVLDTLLFGKK
jgi:hypothetical protein